MPTKGNFPSPFAGKSPTPSDSPFQGIGSVLSSLKTAEQLASLTSASATLNSLSDQLSKEVSAIESVLNQLNLGIEANVQGVILKSSEPEQGDFCSRWLRLAYGKSGSKWGLMIEELTEDPSEPDGNTYQSWLFSEAPRDFRLKVVEKIPALLDALVAKSAEVAADITKKVTFARELASTFPKLSPGSKK